MVKNCPPGVICIDNLGGFIILFIFICVLVYIKNKPHVINESPLINESPVINKPIFRESERIVNIPINIPTQGIGFNTNYEQIGILTNNKEEILPLYGKLLLTNRSKWSYYTMNNSYNSIRLPISYKNRSCTSEYGCDELMNGDKVYVEGYNSVFDVKIYEKNTLNYIPLII